MNTASPVSSTTRITLRKSPGGGPGIGVISQFMRSVSWRMRPFEPSSPAPGTKSGDASGASSTSSQPPSTVHGSCVAPAGVYS